MWRRIGFLPKLFTFLNEQYYCKKTKKKIYSETHRIQVCIVTAVNVKQFNRLCVRSLVTSLWDAFVVVIWQPKITHELSKRIKDGGYWIFVHKVTLQGRLLATHRLAYSHL